MAGVQGLDPGDLTLFESVAGHRGVMSDSSGELLIKPCTLEEISFYQTTHSEHPDFAELVPTFMGTLELGASSQVAEATANAINPADAVQLAQEQHRAHGSKIKTEVAIVLENLEYGFKRANVLDLKLGARLYADGTEAEKAARMDKVSAETTSGSLNFRIAGMRVWNEGKFDVYDKQYGRRLNAENVETGFAAFFASLERSLQRKEAQELLETMLAEIIKLRHTLERNESRMYSASILIVYEGDSDALKTLIGREPTPMGDERAPTVGEVKEAEEEDEDEFELPVAFKVRMIDFAHASWTPGQGKDENVITGLQNIEKQMDQLIARYD